MNNPSNIPECECPPGTCLGIDSIFNKGVIPRMTTSGGTFTNLSAVAVLIASETHVSGMGINGTGKARPVTIRCMLHLQKARASTFGAASNAPPLHEPA